MSASDVEATLRQSGLAKWVKRFKPLSPVGSDTTLILQIEDGEWDLYGKQKGKPAKEIDYDAAYEVSGSQVEVIHSAGSNTFRWSVTGDTLTLKWLNGTIPPTEGIPEEVFQRALYMTQEFEDQG